MSKSDDQNINLEINAKKASWIDRVVHFSAHTILFILCTIFATVLGSLIFIIITLTFASIDIASELSSVVSALFLFIAAQVLIMMLPVLFLIYLPLVISMIRRSFNALDMMFLGATLYGLAYFCAIVFTETFYKAMHHHALDICFVMFMGAIIGLVHFCMFALFSSEYRKLVRERA